MGVLNILINNWMRVSDLFEAPISDFNLIGNWDKNSSFRHESDRKMITHPKFVQHLTNKWARTNADFNIYLVNSPEANRHTEIGEVTQEWLDTNLPQASKEIIIKNNAINIIYTNNKGDQRMPMTPWIMAHRFGHAVLASRTFGFTAGRPSTFRSDFKDATDELKRVTIMLLAEYGYNIDDRLKTNFYHAIGTMRAARERQLRNPLEFLLDLLAQYMITGSIKFNPLPKEFKHKNYFVKFQGNDHDYQYFAGALPDLAETLESILAVAVARH